MAEARVKELEAALVNKEGWHDCAGGTSMEQSRYEELAQAGRTFSEEEAKKEISQEFGFAKEAITILFEVNTYEANNVGRMRKKGTFVRKPIYAATDWNYIRFNVKNWMYEMVNGMLKFYEC